ncbi:hypothetical protein CYMTET_11356 [Cymbomonas tetramitiformis]|uniref:Reverse transcriptase domain-containing protein n=1 Tax=Cymbomonas tetramitiformis TaxID=36881 RepID=A0AAE0GMF8_9CHLO|nr:hypothetical protein CYMTET_11356 [Cymbomonas tetramitiformis]
MRWVKAAKLLGAQEMLEFALSGGEFEPAEFSEDGDAEMVTPAKLVPPGRGGPAFCEVTMEAADQCVEVLVGELRFKVPEVPQASLSPGARGAGKDRRDAESEDEPVEEASAEEDLFGEEEEIAAAPRKLKKAKRDDGEPSSDDLAVNEALKRRVDAWLGARVGGYEPAKGATSDLALREQASAKLRRKVVADSVTGELNSVAVPRLSRDQFIEQNFEMVEKIADLKERSLFRKYVGWILTLAEKYSWADMYDFDMQKRLTEDGGGNKNRNPRDPKGPQKRRDGLCDFFQSARGYKKGKDYGFLPETTLEPEVTAVKERNEVKARKPERKWSAKLLAMFTAVGVSLASYGVPEADWRQYQHEVEAVGARVSPLTERADRWAQAAWGLPGAEEVVRGVATGFDGSRSSQRSSSNWRIMSRLSTGRRRFMFGVKATPGLFSDITVLISRMLQSRGFPGVVVYLDDFLLVADFEEASQRGFVLVMELVEYLGFEVAPEKVESPRQDIVFLGVRLHSNHSRFGIVTMSIDESRVQRVAAECRHVAGLKRARRLRKVFDNVPEVLGKDLLWLAKMLEINNGQAVVLNKRPVVQDFFAVDAAGEEAVDGGMGGLFGGRWFSVKWDEVKRWKVLPFSPFRDEASNHINYPELFVIFWALKLWGHLLRGCKIVLWSNNEAARLMTENLWGKATFIPLLKDILLLTLKHDLRIVTRRISSKANVFADALSRSEMGRFFELQREWSQRDAPRDLDDWMFKDWLWKKAKLFGRFAVDACCDEVGANSRCIRWWSKEDSCLGNKWSGLNVYYNPPFSLLFEILTHFLSEKRVAPRTTSAVFVLPLWPTERKAVLNCFERVPAEPESPAFLWKSRGKFVPMTHGVFVAEVKKLI